VTGSDDELPERSALVLHFLDADRTTNAGKRASAVGGFRAAVSGVYIRP
jgi:hypothetical protein